MVQQIKLQQEESIALTFFSAALHNFLPQLQTKHHETIFKDWQLNVYLARLEQSSLKTLQHTVIENEPNLEEHQPTIFCTYHMGSYRLINLWLISKKINFALVIGADAWKREAKDLVNLYRTHAAQGSAELEIINAEEAGSTFRMMRTLKAGTSLLFYIDGNTGTGLSNEQNENCLLVNFLHHKLWARKGMAYLSHLTGTPILPVLCYRADWLKSTLKFSTFIIPPANSNRHQFAATATQQIFNFVTPFIRKYPAQWEGWMHIHKTACISRRKRRSGHNFKGDTVSFNNTAFGIFLLEGTAYLLQKENYTIFPITANLYKTLGRAAKKPVAGKLFTKAVLQELSAATVLQDV